MHGRMTCVKGREYGCTSQGAPYKANQGGTADMFMFVLGRNTICSVGAFFYEPLQKQNYL